MNNHHTILSQSTTSDSVDEQLIKVVDLSALPSFAMEENPLFTSYNNHFEGQELRRMENQQVQIDPYQESVKKENKYSQDSPNSHDYNEIS